jgi:hypothetical protein
MGYIIKQTNTPIRCNKDTFIDTSYTQARHLQQFWSTQLFLQSFKQESLHCSPIPNSQTRQYRLLQEEVQLPCQALSQLPQLQVTQSLAQPSVQQEKLLVPLLPLQKLWQHPLRTWDLQ